MTVDHITPRDLSKKSRRVPIENAAAACCRCNESKGRSPLIYFLRRHKVKR